MTGAAIAAGYSAWATAAAVAVDVAIVAAGTMSAVSQYQQGKEQQRQADFQAQEAQKQAKLEQERANIAQIQGEREASRRMLALSQEVGSVYANAAGNGILVDSASAGDTLGKALTTSVKSAAEDVSTIRDNTALSVWTHTENKNQLLRSSDNYRKTGKAAYKAGILGATAEGVGTVGKLGSAYAAGGGFSAGAGAGAGKTGSTTQWDFSNIEV